MSLRSTLLLPLLLLAAACSSDPVREPGSSGDDTSVADTGSDTAGSADAESDTGGDTVADTAADTAPADTAVDTGTEPDTAPDSVDSDTTADADATDSGIPPDLCAPVVRSSPLPRPLSADAVGHTWQERRGGLVFDSQGNGVVADADGNLYRIEPTGRRTLWVADAFEAVEAMVYLRSGELAVVDPILGRIRLVYPNAEVRTLVTDLDHPVGLDLDLDGFLMLSEATSATISRPRPAVAPPSSAASTSSPAAWPFRPTTTGSTSSLSARAPSMPWTATARAPGRCLLSSAASAIRAQAAPPTRLGSPASSARAQGSAATLAVVRSVRRHRTAALPRRATSVSRRPASPAAASTTGSGSPAKPAAPAKGPAPVTPACRTEFPASATRTASAA
jgi:hypothetical protein